MGSGGVRAKIVYSVGHDSKNKKGQQFASLCDPVRIQT